MVSLMEQEGPWAHWPPTPRRNFHLHYVNAHWQSGELRDCFWWLCLSQPTFERCFQACQSQGVSWDCSVLASWRSISPLSNLMQSEASTVFHSLILGAEQALWSLSLISSQIYAPQFPKCPTKCLLAFPLCQMCTVGRVSALPHAFPLYWITSSPLPNHKSQAEAGWETTGFRPPSSYFSFPASKWIIPNSRHLI